MAILTVGVGQEFQTIASAVAASRDGDVVQVQAGTYTDDCVEITHKITLEGVGGMVNMLATGLIPNGKAILITDTDVTIDRFAFSGATVNDGNGAGIRYQGGNLTITNSLFQDNQNGILAGPDPSGSITIKNSEFSHNGAGDGYTHNLYVGDVGSLTIDNSYFHDAVVGHEIKSRAESTTITNSRIEDGPNGTASYGIDLPNGGNVVISNDLIEKGPSAQNPIMISYGEEGSLHANSSLTVTNDILLYDKSVSSSSVAVRNSTSTAVTVQGNSIYGLASAPVLLGSGTAANNTTLASEPALNTSSPIGSTSTPPSSTGRDQTPGSPVSVGSIPPSSDSGGLPASSGSTPPPTNSGGLPVSSGSTPPPSNSGGLPVSSGSTPPPSNSGGLPVSSGSTPPPSEGSNSSVFRFFDTASGTQFLTASRTERASILATRPDLTSEGVGFRAVTGADDPAVSAVYRFFDIANGTHFFTSSTVERDQVEATRSDLTYEGLAFHEYATPQPGAAAVYRFFDSAAGTHFFTDSASERASILNSRPDLIAEGIAFYSPSGS